MRSASVVQTLRSAIGTPNPGPADQLHGFAAAKQNELLHPLQVGANDMEQKYLGEEVWRAKSSTRMKIEFSVKSGSNAAGGGKGQPD